MSLESENRAIIAIAMIFSLRILGMFMLIPVFSVYAQGLAGSTPSLAGIAFGIYGLTQALLLFPFGWISDHLGRKPVITAGLLILALGSIICAMSTSIYAMIIGRALQGSGAIGSTALALIADVTKEKNRTKAMAIVGVSIGLSFVMAFIAGSVINHWIGTSAIFWITAALAVLAIIVLHTFVPSPHNAHPGNDNLQSKPRPSTVWLHPDLIRLNIGIFSQHAIFSACFFILPIIFTQLIDISGNQQWLFYLPLMLASFIGMLPLIFLAERKGKMKLILLGCIASTVVSLLFLATSYNHFTLIAFWLFFYFVSFNFLEASLPSLVSKIAPPTWKGTATGIYSSSQFFGIFCGASAAGWMYAHFPISWIFYGCAFLAIIWLGFSLQIQLPASTQKQAPTVKQEKAHS